MSSLAAARADGYYYPKDWDPSKGSLNQFQKSHPLGVRAKKIDEGILVIRFETPFHIRCEKCLNMIAKGVRFNAEKKQVGKYFSTLIYEFAMKCPSCSNRIAVQTDPENCDYKYVMGAKKFLSLDNASTDVVEYQNKQIHDPFEKLEVQVKDRQVGKLERPRLQQIKDKQDIWENDYAVNSMLRKKFRQEKLVLKKEKAKRKEVKNVGIRLLPVSQQDLNEAKSVRFGVDQCKTKMINKFLKIKSANIFDGQHNPHQEIQAKIAVLPTATHRQLKSQIKDMRQRNNKYNKLEIMGKIKKSVMQSCNNIKQEGINKNIIQIQDD